MTPLEWFALSIGLVVALFVLRLRLSGWLFRTDRERPVLPSHYSAALYTDPTRYPGHCTACATDNEPGYRYCESCGEPIPSSDGFGDGDQDLGRILGE